MDDRNQKIFDHRWILYDAIADIEYNPDQELNFKRTPEGDRIGLHQTQIQIVCSVLLILIIFGIQAGYAYAAYDYSIFQSWSRAQLMVFYISMGTIACLTILASIFIATFRRWLLLDSARAKVIVITQSMFFSWTKKFDKSELEAVLLQANYDNRQKGSMPNWAIKLKLYGNRMIQLTAPLFSFSIYSGWKSQNDYNVVSLMPKIAWIVSQAYEVPFWLVYKNEKITVKDKSDVLNEEEKGEITGEHNRNVSLLQKDLLFRLGAIILALVGVGIFKFIKHTTSDKELISLVFIVLATIFITIALSFFISKKKV